MRRRADPTYDIGRQLADDPVVVVVDDFVTEAECKHVINQARRDMGSAKVTRDGTYQASAGRTGEVAWVKHGHTPIVRGLVKRVSELVAIPVSHAESLQVVHYGETQEYRPHHDAWDLSTANGKERTAASGQRLITALMYLNEVDAGGATEFPGLKIQIEPVPGRMALFHNTSESGDLHRKSLHGGLPVVGGEKWVANLWFRERPYSPGGGARPRPATTRSRGNAKKSRKSQKSARRKNR